MSFQAVRAVFEVPVIDALAGLSPSVPAYVDNQAFTVPDAGQEYATINLQFGDTTSRVLSGNLEKLTGSLVIECYTAKNTGPARAQEMITPVMQALNGLNSCNGYEATGAVGWVGDMTGPAFFALDDAWCRGNFTTTTGHVTLECSATVSDTSRVENTGRRQ